MISPLVVLALAASGMGWGGPRGELRDVAPPRTHTIRIKDSDFGPHRLQVAVGDTVIWVNEDIVPHTASAQPVFNSKGIEPHHSWVWVAKRPGAFQYACLFHPTMKAEVTVHGPRMSLPRKA